MLVAVLVAMLGLCLASGSLGHLRLVARSDNSAQALDLARSACSTAIARLQGGQTAPDVEIVGPNGVGRVSFGAQADSWSIPRSLDNLTGDASRPGHEGRPLPPYSSQIVAVGTAHGVERTVTALVHLPVFPYAAASEGPLLAPQALLVARQGEDGLWPASLRTNGDLSLGSGSRIVGDVVASGDISAPPESVQVDGRLRPREPREALARIALDQYDPRSRGLASATLTPIMFGGTLSGVNRAAGDLTVDGDLKLNAALVYVPGDATVHGSLTGSGLLVAGRSLTIEGHGVLANDSKLGLACGGKLSVLGEDRERSALHGFLYAEGGLALRNISIHGVVVNLGDEPAEFDRCALYYEESAGRAEALPGAGNDVATIYITFGGEVRLTPGTGSYYQVTARRDGTGFRLLSYESIGHGERGHNEQIIEGVALPDLAALTRVVQEQGITHGAAAGDIQAAWRSAFGDTGPEVAAPETVLKLEPSELLPRADRFRITLWEEP